MTLDDIFQQILGPKNGSDNLLPSRRPKPRPSWQATNYFVAVLFDSDNNNPYISCHGEDYYEIVEKAHDGNPHGWPFLFLSLFGNCIQDQNVRLTQWMLNCCRGNLELESNCMEIICPKLNRIGQELNAKFYKEI